MLVIVENYPQLKSNENFMRLQDELAGTENRIAVERQRYNETVQDYNTYIGLFPNSLVASMAGFARNDAYFKTDEGARQAPKVNFDFNKPAATPLPPQPTHSRASIPGCVLADLHFGQQPSARVVAELRSASPKPKAVQLDNIGPWESRKDWVFVYCERVW